MDVQTLVSLSPAKLINLIQTQLSDPMTRNTYFTGMLIRQLGVKTFETSYSTDWQKILRDHNLSANITSYVVLEGSRLIGIFGIEIDAVNISSHDSFRRIVLHVDSNGKIKPRMPWIYTDD
jgi:hypothetical protein